jgi:hypothetical protein
MRIYRVVYDEVPLNYRPNSQRQYLTRKGADYRLEHALAAGCVAHIEIAEIDEWRRK